VIRRGFLALGLAASLVAAPALAVDRKPAAKKPAAAVEKAPAPPEPSSPSDGAPPYETQLLRLSELMGALTYLRGLCGDGDAGEYRARMSALLEAEAATPERREKLAGAYNVGYRGYQTTYSSCTPNARIVIGKFIDEGGRIAHEISYRFGGS
jgi:uncharacterized protein (TIGR02301 family)